MFDDDDDDDDNYEVKMIIAIEVYESARTNALYTIHEHVIIKTFLGSANTRITHIIYT